MAVRASHEPLHRSADGPSARPSALALRGRAVRAPSPLPVHGPYARLMAVAVLHEPSLRSGVSAERRHFSEEKFAALCRDAATIEFMVPVRDQDAIKLSPNQAKYR